MRYVHNIVIYDDHASWFGSIGTQICEFTKVLGAKGKLGIVNKYGYIAIELENPYPDCEHPDIESLYIACASEIDLNEAYNRCCDAVLYHPKTIDLRGLDAELIELDLGTAPSSPVSSRTRRFYTINGTGKYSMSQVIGEYIIFHLKRGTTFEEIRNKISKDVMFVSTVRDGVSVHKGQDPYFAEYNGTKYYITTQLRNKKPSDNFSVFMKYVNNNEPNFQISPLLI